MSQGEARAADGPLLAVSELFRELGPDALTSIESDIRYRDLPAGGVLVAEGDLAEELYLLLEGELEVVLHAGEAGEQTLTRLPPGSTVGEIALLAGDRRSATVRASLPSRVAVITGEGFGRLLREHPAHAEVLARNALERLRETQLVGQLNQLFGHLEAEVLATINDFVEWLPARAGTRLFAEGELGDAAYLVVTGRLRAFRTDVHGAEVDVGEIGRGEMAGEMALLEEEPRSASVYAVRDSQLVRFSKAAFDALIARYPAAGLLVAHTVLRRARRGAGKEPRQEHLSVVVVPGPGVDGADLGRQLTAALGAEARYVTSETIDVELGRPGISQAGDEDVGSIRLAYSLEELQERNRYLVYGIDDTWSPWSRRALRWADHVVVAVDATAAPEIGDLEAELWRLVEQQRHPKVSLVLLHPPDTEQPAGTRAWLDRRPVTSHHHLRRNDVVTMERLGRLLTGTATSLVLGGGGARGFAHLGVFVVLEELHVPIDMIAGASIGAIMAIGPGLDYSAEQSRAAATEQFKDFMDYTLPAVSVLKGERIADKLRKALGDIDIADLWIPYFCVSTNLTTPGAHYHDRGRLVDAVRASLAIPGLLPPVPLDGQLLVDGGVLDNVPVDEMRRRNPTGTIIAVDVAAAAGQEPAYDYGLSVSGFRAVLDRKRGTAPPGMLSTLVRSSLIASVRDRDRVIRDGIADLYLDVDVADVSLLDFKAADHIATSAELSTRPILRRWVRGQSGDELGYVRTTAARSAVIEDDTRRSRGYGLFLLTIRDLQHRAVRFAAVIAGTAVVLALLFLMTGLVEQFHREPERTVDAFGAEGWLLREGVSGAFTAASTMPVDTLDQVDVEDAAPVVIARHSISGDDGQTDVVIAGYVPGGVGEPELVEGTLPNAPTEVVVDDTAGSEPGEEILIGEQVFTVVGVTDGTTMFAGMPLVFMDITTAQELVYRGQPLATAILLGSAGAEAPDGFVVRDNEEVAEDGIRPLDGAISSINIIRVLLWFVAAMIIGTMIYLSALERRRDVAVLKAVGSSTSQMAASIALQAVITALVASAIAAVLQLVLVPVFPLEVSVPASAFYQIPVIAVLVALLAGLVGVRKAVRVDPALAFSGPGA